MSVSSSKQAAKRRWLAKLRKEAKEWALQKKQQALKRRKEAAEKALRDTQLAEVRNNQAQQNKKKLKAKHRAKKNPGSSQRIVIFHGGAFESNRRRH